MWIVQIALRRPYTFVVFAFLIAIFGTLAGLRTPTDIFPNINIPVVSVVWTYNGLLPNDMSGRVIYYYERYMTAQVADIEHLESQSLNGYGVVKIFFQKNVNIAAAVAQVTAASQTVLKLLPPGITPPYVLSYNASSVPILQLALSSKKLPQMQLFDLGQNFIRPQLSTVAGAAVPSPYGGKVLQVQVDLDQQAMQAHNVSADDVVNTITAQNLVLPAGDQKFGKFDWNVALNASPDAVGQDQRSAGQEGQRHDHLHARRSLRAFRLAATDQPGSRQRLARRADDDPQGRRGLDAQRHRRHQITAAAGRGEPAGEPQSARRRRSVDLRQGRRFRRHPRGGARRRAGRR